MTPVKVFIRNHPVLTYFALTFAISWGGVLLVVGGSKGMSGTAPTNDPRFVYALLAMLAGPSISGIVLTAIVERKDGLRTLLSRALNWRVAARWHAVALLTAPLLWLATLFALSLTSSNFLPLAAFRVLMVWVYDRTGSLLIAMLMHASLTSSVLILDPVGISGVALLTYSFALAAAVWAAVAVIAARNGWHFSQRPLQTVRRAA